RMLLRSDKRLNAPTPAESRVYRSEKWKIQAPEEPPWDFNVLKAISLRPFSRIQDFLNQIIILPLR
ncbi:MAG: hypothetical protein ACHQIM_11840, partial [Sphingobacteriales bacterium]